MLRVDMTPVNGVIGAESALTADAPPGAPTDLVPVTAAATRSVLRTEFPSVLVASSSGGAGATVVALGVASALVADPQLYPDAEPVCVDATPSGTDLADRGCDALRTTSNLQIWLGGPTPGLYSAVEECSGETTLGVRVMTRTPDPLPRRETFASAHRHLLDAGTLPVFDGGPVTNRETLALLADPRVGLIITVAARPDHLKRLKHTLTWLDDHAGEFLLAGAVIAVTEQIPGTQVGQAAATHVRDWVGRWVRSVVAVPFDPHLADGGVVSWLSLTRATRNAFRQMAGDLR